LIDVKEHRSQAAVAQEPRGIEEAVTAVALLSKARKASIAEVVARRALWTMQRVVQVVFAAVAVVDAAAVAVVVVAATAAAGKGEPTPFLHSASPGVSAQMERMAQQLQTPLTMATAIAREKAAAAVRAP
jgi:hypothetical protein